MKAQDLKFSLLIVMVGVAVLNCFAQGQQAKDINIPEYQKINLYSYKDIRGEREHLGSAIWNNGEVIINVTDSKIEQTLKSPFTVLKSEDVEDGGHAVYVEELSPGTYEHLIAVVRSLKGYVAIPEKESK